MALPFRSLPTAAALREHDARIDICRGTACFQDLCLGLNETSANELARQIDGDHGRIGRDGTKQFSGKYRQWRYGKAPAEETIVLVESRFPGKTRLRRWRNLLLWDLLREPFELTLSELHERMTHLPPRIRKLLFLSAGPNAMGRYPRHAMSRERILELRDLHSLDAFIALLALAREGELINEDQRHVFRPCVRSASSRTCSPRIRNWKRAGSRCTTRFIWRSGRACIWRASIRTSTKSGSSNIAPPCASTPRRVAQWVADCAVIKSRQCQTDKSMVLVTRIAALIGRTGTLLTPPDGGLGEADRPTS